MESKRNIRRILYIALSVLVAIIIWVVVDQTGDNGSARTVEKVFKDVPIEYVGESLLSDRGLMLLEDGTDTSAEMTLSGTRWNISALEKSELKLQVDLTDVTDVGQQRVSIKITYPDGVKGIQRTSPSVFMATVNIGELYSKTVEVRCERVGNVADGYTAGELVLSPATLEIRGLQSDIDAVEYAKVVLNYDNATATIRETLDIQFYDKNDQLLTSTGVHSTVENVQATLPVNVTKELRLVMNFIESDGARASNVEWTIEPKTITVSGDAEQLKNVETIVLDDFDLATLNSNTNYSYTIPLPSGCENLSGITRATLKISFRDMKTDHITTSNFQCENVAEGRTAQVLTEALNVEVFGTSADVDSTTGDDLLVKLDLKDFGSAAGTYTVPVEITALGDRDLGISGTYTVRVTISEEKTDEPVTSEDTDTSIGEIP